MAVLAVAGFTAEGTISTTTKGRARLVQEAASLRGRLAAAKPITFTGAKCRTGRSRMQAAWQESLSTL